MTKYANGRIPRSALVSFQEGGVTFYTTPYVLQQYRYMKADAAKQGVHLYITVTPTSVVNGVGGNAYRDIPFQQRMRAVYGRGAAYPGTSSHGGTFEGRDSMALDISGWGHKGVDWFYALARKWGFTPGLISTSRGYAVTEEWHLVMWNPFRSVKPASETPHQIINRVKEEIGLDVSQIRYVHRVQKGYDPEWMIVGMEIPGGFRVTTKETVAVGYGAAYGTPDGDSWKALNRTQYIALQNTMRELNAAYVKQQKEIARG